MPRRTEASADKISKKRRVRDNILKAFVYFCTALTVGLLIWIIGYILLRGLPNISLKLLFTEPSILKNTIGILPNILNTLYIIILSLLIVLPLGVGAAVYLTEYAKNKKIVRAIEFATETLSGIPSIIYGLVGMLFFCQLLKLKTSLLAGSLTLVIMILPTIIRTTQEALKTVPQSYREGAAGLGAGKWHMIHTIILPCCIDGIVTGCILSAGRIIGESAALLFTAGIGSVLVTGLGNILKTSSGTLSVALYVYVYERGNFDVGFAIAAILLVIIFAINLLCSAAKKKLKNR